MKGHNDWTMGEQGGMSPLEGILTAVSGISLFMAASVDFSEHTPGSVALCLGLLAISWAAYRAAWRESGKGRRKRK